MTTLIVTDWLTDVTSFHIRLPSLPSSLLPSLSLPLLQNLTNCFPNSIYFEFRRRGNGRNKQYQAKHMASITVRSIHPSVEAAQSPIHSSCHFPTKLTLRGRILATKSEPKQKFSLSCLRYLLFNPPSCRHRPKIDTLDHFLSLWWFMWPQIILK